MGVKRKRELEFEVLWNSNANLRRFLKTLREHTRVTRAYECYRELTRVPKNAQEFQADQERELEGYMYSKENLNRFKLLLSARESPRAHAR